MANTQTGIHSEKQGYGRPKRRINLLLGIENTKRWLATKPKKEGVTDEWLFSHLLDVHEKYCTCRCSPVVEMDAKRTPTDQFKQVLQSKHHILPYDRNQLFRSEEITEDTDNLGVNGSVLLNQPVSNSDTCENQTELPQKGTVANTPWRVQTTKNVNVVQPPRLDSLVSTGNLRHTGEPDKSKLIRLTVLPTPAAGDVQLRHSQQAVPMISVLNLNGNKKETNINIPDVNNVPLLAAINQHQVKQSEFQCEDSNRHGISKSFSTSSSAEETGVPVVKNVSAPVTVSQVPQQNQIFSGLSLLRTADVTSVPVGTNRTLQHLLLQTSPGQQGKQSSPQLTMLRRVVIDPNSSSVPVRTSKATSSGNAQISYVKQIHTSPHTMTSSADPLLREDDISFGNSTTTQIPNSVNVVTQAMQVIPPNVTVLRQSVVSNSCAVPGVSIVTNSAASDSARNWSTGDQETTTDVKPELSMLLDDSYVGNENIEPFRKSSSCGVITKQPNSSLNVEPYNIKFLLFPKELNNGDKIGDKLKFSQHPSMNLMAKGMTRSSALNPPDEGPGSEKKMYILNFLEMYFTAKMMEQQGIPMKVSGKVYRNMYIILQTWLHVFYGIKVSSSAVKSKCDKVFTRFCVHEEHYNKTSCKESFNTLCRFLSKSISSIWFSDLTKSSEEHEEIDPSGSSHQENDTQGNSEFDFRVYRVFHDDDEEEDMKPDITEEERPDPEKESSMAPQNWEMVFPIKQEPEEWTSAVHHSVEQNLPNDDSPVNLLPKEEELDSDSESRHSDLNPGNMRKSENDHLSEAEQDQLSGSSQMTQLDQDQPSVPSGPDQGNSDSIKENLSAQNKSSRSKYLTQPKDQSLDSNDVIQTKRKETSVSDQFKPGRRHLEPRGKRKKFAEDFTLLFKSDSEDDDSISEACQPERDEEVHRKRKQKRVSEDFVELLDSEDEYLPPEERIQDHNKRKRFAEHSNLVQLDSASESMSKDEDDDDKNEDDDVKNDDDVYNDEDDNEVNSRAPHKGGKLFNKLGQVVRYNEEFKQEVVAYAISTNFSAAAKKFDIQRDRIRVWKKKMTFLQDDDLTKVPMMKRKRAKRTAYSAAFKLKVVTFAEATNNVVASKKFNVNEKQVREWRKMKLVLQKMPKGKLSLRRSPKQRFGRLIKTNICNSTSLLIAKLPEAEVSSLPSRTVNLLNQPGTASLLSTNADTTKQLDVSTLCLTTTEITNHPGASSLVSLVADLEKRLDTSNLPSGQGDLSLEQLEASSSSSLTASLTKQSDDSSSLSTTSRLPDTDEDVQKDNKECVKQKRDAYEAGFKLKVVAFAEKFNNSRASRKFNVHERQVRNWRTIKTKLQEMPERKKAQRASVSPHHELENKLIAWIKELRQSGYMVTRTMIRNQTIDLYKKKQDKGDTSSPSSCVFSSTWCSNFLRRHGLSLYRRVFLIDALSPHIQHKVDTFYHNLHKKRFKLQKKYDLRQIGCMDEIPLTLNINKGFSDQERNETEKVNLTVVLACLSDGTKLKPMVISEKKCEKVQPGIITAVQPNSYMDERLVLQWLGEVWMHRPKDNNSSKSVLVWDRFSAHLCESVQKKLKDSSIMEVQIPYECSSVLHPVQVCLKHNFISTIYESFLEWKEKCFQPSELMDNILLWVKQAWDLVPEDFVKRSFERCGVIKTRSIPGAEKMKAVMEQCTLDSDLPPTVDECTDEAFRLYYGDVTDIPLVTNETGDDSNCSVESSQNIQGKFFEGVP